jgi:hypothetical protein
LCSNTDHVRTATLAPDQDQVRHIEAVGFAFTGEFALYRARAHELSISPVVLAKNDGWTSKKLSNKKHWFSVGKMKVVMSMTSRSRWVGGRAAVAACTFVRAVATPPASVVLFIAVWSAGGMPHDDSKHAATPWSGTQGAFWFTCSRKHTLLQRQILNFKIAFFASNFAQTTEADLSAAPEYQQAQEILQQVPLTA